KLPEDRAYSTLGGFALAHLGSIPRGGESFEFAGYRFTVLEMERHRVARIKLQRLLPATPAKGIPPKQTQAIPQQPAQTASHKPSSLPPTAWASRNRGTCFPLPEPVRPALPGPVRPALPEPVPPALADLQDHFGAAVGAQNARGLSLVHGNFQEAAGADKRDWLAGGALREGLRQFLHWLACDLQLDFAFRAGPLRQVFRREVRHQIAKRIHAEHQPLFG